tara:strand:- start:186 stop:1073 length:888 start_codon:yes stop_codon:yes gene_type:complete
LPSALSFTDALPPLLALCSAVLFALSIQLSNLGLRDIDSTTGVLIQISMTTTMYWLLAPWFVESAYWFTGAALVFAAVGLVRPALSANLALAGVRYLGPTLASTLTSTSPFFGVAFGVLLLGELLTWPIALGTLAVVAGTMLLTRPDSRQAAWPLWAVALPLGAAFIRAGGHGLTKFGFAEVPSPFFAALVGHSVSFVVTASAAAWRGGVKRRPLTSYGTLCFVAAGVINGVSLLCLNTALHLGEVVAVVPIVSASPMITLLLGVLVFKRERFTARGLLAMAVIIPGVMGIAFFR